MHVILLALVGVGPLCFLESKAIAAVHQEIIELSMLQSTDKLYRDADFLSSRAFHLLIVPKLLPNGLPVILSLCLIDHPTELTIQLNIHPGGYMPATTALERSQKDLRALVGAYWLKRTKSNELLKRLFKKKNHKFNIFIWMIQCNCYRKYRIKKSNKRVTIE